MTRAENRNHLLNTDELARFDQDGYFVIPDALSPSQIAGLETAIQRAIGPEGVGKAHNRAAILGMDSAFLDLVDLDTVFPKICQLLGWNIYVNHTHFNVNPPDKPDPAFVYGWHRDGGAMHNDLRNAKAPLAAIKVAFYLTDLSKPDHGQTHVIPGGHRAEPDDARNAELLRRDGPWAKAAMPPNAVRLDVTPGTAVIFHNRLIHSQRTPNTAGPERRAVFIQWAYRWLQSVDPMNVAALEPTVSDPVRRQLLGFDVEDVFSDAYGQGRSRRYYPSADASPVRRYCVDTLGLDAAGSPW